MISTDFTNWHKARASAGTGGQCVEVGYTTTLTGIRDTTLGETSPIAVASHGTFRAFIDAVHDGKLRG
ncbi:MAG: DUF397 domain-containing protein [Sciscionella sp.]